MDEEQKFKCGDCKHFKQHYVKMTKRFAKTICGHCMFRVSTAHGGARLYDSAACGKWEKLEKEEKKSEGLEYTLLEMAKQIKEIAELLKNEE